MLLLCRNLMVLNLLITTVLWTILIAVAEVAIMVLLSKVLNKSK